MQRFSARRRARCARAARRRATTARAVLLLHELDREIQARSDGERDLDDVVRALIPIREVSLADLRAAAQRARGARRRCSTRRCSRSPRRTQR